MHAMFFSAFHGNFSKTRLLFEITRVIELNPALGNTVIYQYLSSSLRNIISINSTDGGVHGCMEASIMDGQPLSREDKWRLKRSNIKAGGRQMNML
jgi:hypothetical protein